MFGTEKILKKIVHENRNTEKANMNEKQLPQNNMHGLTVFRSCNLIELEPIFLLKNFTEN